jgi:hypothetical protein
MLTRPSDQIRGCAELVRQSSSRHKCQRTDAAGSRCTYPHAFTTDRLATEAMLEIVNRHSALEADTHSAKRSTRFARHGSAKCRLARNQYGGSDSYARRNTNRRSVDRQSYGFRHQGPNSDQTYRPTLQSTITSKVVTGPYYIPKVYAIAGRIG